MTSTTPVSSNSIARIALACAVVSLIGCVVLFESSGGRMKIGYVRTTELVYGFAGMKEAHDIYEKKRQGWQSLLDSLGADYQRSVSAYNAERVSVTASGRQERESFLQKQHESLEGQRSELEARIRDEDQRMTQGVLSQINSLAQQYGKEHGFDLILSTTQSGSILYGDDAIDLTKDLLATLNRNYNPSAPQNDPVRDSSR